jgi:2-polyprenyl-3-methyl-5-hydroxy-6-metoxy-1,4-benzoquinol methylase
MKCKICFTEPLSIKSVLFDDRFGCPGKFDFYVCPSCGHGMLDLNLTSTEISDLYTRYYPRGAGGISPEENAKRIKPKDKFWAFKWVPDGAKVLDIGCGDGSSLMYLQNRGCDAQGVDSDQNVARIAAQYGLNIKVGVFDPGDYAEQSFDYVVMEQLIEHIADPVAMLKSVSSILKPEGSLVLSTPNMQSLGAKWFKDAWLHWHAPYHVSFFTRKSLELCLQAAGFRLEKIFTKTNPIFYKWQFQHLFLRSRAAGKPSRIWSPYYVMKAGESDWDVDVCQALADGLSEIRFFHIYGFLLECLGWGDNFVAILRKTQ